ncbi:hypothetical protein ASC87_15600 [Rhizobacter sp. Root1221]|nr:hypothetical protein ASC87_15600 [Rhizobacter sp. Root1221]
MQLTLDASGPLNEQVARALRAAMADGRLAPGSRLPSSRTLAADLAVSRNTVLLACEQLRVERLVVTRPGAGLFVAGVPARPAARRRGGPVAPQSAYAARLRALGPVTLAAGPTPHRYDLQYGEPLLNPPLAAAWGAALATAAAHTDTRYAHAQGLPELREAVCGHLARWRGVVAHPDDVVIVSGAQQALALAARVLLDAGDGVAVEDPHYQMAHQALEAHGARITSVRTDTLGIVVPDIPVESRLIHVTPAHQFPSGVTMSPSRRAALLRHAAAHGAWVFEDDCDGELGHGERPVPALRAADRHDRVVHVGSFSKTMFPSLRLGYMVCPAGLRRDFVRAKQLDDLGCPAVAQAAMAALVSRGAFDRHLRKSMAELRKRRVALLSGLARHAAGHVQVAATTAAMHVVGWLPHLDAAGAGRLLVAARARGLGLHLISPYYRTPPSHPGLLLGYAGLSPVQIAAATDLLGQCLRDAA